MEPSSAHTPARILTTMRLVRVHRQAIGLCVLAFTTLSVALSLVSPRVYQARTTLLPPVAGASGGLPAPGMQAAYGFLGLPDESATAVRLFEQILRSRVLMEQVIADQDLLTWFDLADRAQAEAMEEAVTLLSGACSFRIGEAGILEIMVRFGTPWFAGAQDDQRARQRAADVANSFVEQLGLIDREKSLSRAKQTRLYLETQREETEREIRELGTQAASFQKAHGAVALEVQTKALVENAAELKGRMLVKEVELGIAERTMTPDNPIVARLRAEVDQLRRGLADLAGQAPAPASPSAAESSWMGLQASAIPDLQLVLAEYERDFQAQLLLQAYLNQQYYQAKIDEAREAPTIQVLDPAVPPVGKLYPKRRIMVIGGFLSGVIIGLLVAAILEGILPLPRPREG